MTRCHDICNDIRVTHFSNLKGTSFSSSSTYSLQKNLTFVIEFFEHVQFIRVARFKIILFMGNFPLFHVRVRRFRDSRIPSFTISSTVPFLLKTYLVIPRDRQWRHSWNRGWEYPIKVFRFWKKYWNLFHCGVVQTTLTVVRNWNFIWSLLSFQQRAL